MSEGDITGSCVSEGMVWAEEVVVTKDVSLLETPNGIVLIMANIYWHLLCAGRYAKQFVCISCHKPPNSLSNSICHIGKLRLGEVSAVPKGTQLESGRPAQDCILAYQSLKLVPGAGWLCHLVYNFLCSLKTPQANPRLVRAAHRLWLSHPNCPGRGNPGVFSSKPAHSRMFSSPVPLSQPRPGPAPPSFGSALEIQWEAIAMATGLGPGFTSSNSTLKPKRLRN